MIFDIEKKILEYITLEDLPDELREWVEIIGIDAVKAILKYSGGQRVYLPKPSSYKVKALKRELKNIRELDKRKVRQLSRDWDLSQTAIQNLITELKIHINQERLF